MVWPESARFEFFDEVRASYQLAAQDVAGLFLPAGEAWIGAWALAPQLQLYGSDGYHPSELGTYLAGHRRFRLTLGARSRWYPCLVSKRGMEGHPAN